jgi:DNA-binding IclR family transcriptional regulator
MAVDRFKGMTFRELKKHMIAHGYLKPDEKTSMYWLRQKYLILSCCHCSHLPCICEPSKEAKI